MSAGTSTTVAAILIAGGFLLFSQSRRKTKVPLPPSPPAEPILGHARVVPSERQEDFFRKCAQEYGDVFYLKFPGQEVIVLNSVETANDLLERRSAIYSGRPKFTLFHLMGWVDSVAFEGYGDLFRIQRRILQDYLNSRKVVKFRSDQMIEANVLLKNLLRDPANLQTWLERFAAAIILNVAYGHQVESDNDEFLEIISGVNYAMSNCGAPGNTPIDFMPILRFFPSWFPGAYYAGHARKYRKYIEDLHEVPFERVQQEMQAGTAKPSLVLHNLEKPNPLPLLHIQRAAGVIYAAGGETTASTIWHFFFAMTLFPEYQKRAQKEIDEVVGSHRLPDFDDRASLPYVECVFQEILRWYPVAPMAVPHQSTEDDVYNGMFIPKGAVIIGNIKSMSRDERKYADPDRFNPSRYLPKPEGNNEPHPEFAFGFGRRKCPGRHLANGSVWISITRIPATMDISKALDTDGVEITPPLTFTSGITSHPVPFPCQIKPRNSACVELIQQALTREDN